uniref:Uncharacterized protein n=1 Tax=Rousettus aegyptiacus TaxID=9407 RepID=A0A7J8IM53_ROUAE|nr:hypothetical protein HJG63_010588 [Rousettus aegyptiacus]
MGRGSREKDRKVVAREVEKESEDYGAMEFKEGKTFGELGLFIFSQNRTPLDQRQAFPIRQGLLEISYQRSPDTIIFLSLPFALSGGQFANHLLLGQPAVCCLSLRNGKKVETFPGKTNTSPS